jgi:hypothetical protein
MQIGVDSFGAVISESATGVTLSPVERMGNLLEEIVLADQVCGNHDCHRMASSRGVRARAALGCVA